MASPPLKIMTDTSANSMKTTGASETTVEGAPLLLSIRDKFNLFDYIDNFSAKRRKSPYPEPIDAFHIALFRIIVIINPFLLKKHLHRAILYNCKKLIRDYCRH